MQIVFLVSGLQKAAPLALVLDDRSGKSWEPPPAARVRPRAGQLIWLLDQPAARLWRKDAS